MALIVDASVALKWVIEEEGSDLASQLVTTEDMAAPGLLFIECANVLRTKARRGQLTGEDARAALDAIYATPIRSISTRAHAPAAQVIALELGQTAYDCLYLAVALAERAVLITADEAFFRAASAHPVYRASARLLGA